MEKVIEVHEGIIEILKEISEKTEASRERESEKNAIFNRRRSARHINPICRESSGIFQIDLSMEKYIRIVAVAVPAILEIIQIIKKG